MSKIFFTSDHHFNHENIIKYCNRPYNSISEMNYDYINKWNSVIKISDKVFHLGDFALKSSYNSIRNLTQILNGYKILIKGNHDRFNCNFAVNQLGFNECYTSYIFEHEVSYILNHKPRYDLKIKHLCGHVHEKWKINENGNILNVGVDIWNGYPISLEEINDFFQDLYPNRNKKEQKQ